MSNKHAVKEVPASYKSTLRPLVNRDIQNLISGNPLTENLNLWISATKAKSTSGRGTNKKIELVGIKKLRELILELAVRGKLVPQNPEDEPASELLKKIEAEKAKLAKEGLKTKASVHLEHDDKYIDTPSVWSWIRLGNLAKFIDYRGKTPTKIESGIRLITAKNIRKSYIDLNPEEFISESDYESWMTRGFPRNGDMLFTTEAPMGNAANIHLSEKFALAQRAICFQWHIPEISKFMLLQALAKPFQSQLTDQATGMTATGIKASKLKEIAVVLPPLAEQHRIVAKVDELMALCDQLEQHSEHQLDAHKQLVETLLATLVESENADDLATNWQRLAEHFDTLFSGALTSTAGIGNGGGEWAIDRLKDTILQLAVMGKLVPQNPDDEPASELLKKIDAEKAKLVKEGKIKKQKPLPEITDEEKPFELPDGWEWSKLDSIFLKITDGTHHSPTNSDNGEYLYITAKNIKNNGVLLSNATYVAQDVHEEIYSRCNPEFGDILFIKDGATTGIVTINDIQEPFSMLSSVALLKTSKKNSVNKFLLNSLRAPYFYDEMRSGMTGVAITRVTLKKLNAAYIAFPPLAEQHRIVAKVDELFALCDQLKARLQAASKTQLTLTEALVEQALS
tara:strand:- start:5086 stop:6960 length:1875 start_codon:yes stop_codon:yes gene_type:complete